MNDFLLVVGISALAAGLTFLGAPLAERFDVPYRIVSGALQFAAGIITALVGDHLDAAGDSNRAVRVSRVRILCGRRVLCVAGTLHQAGPG